MTEKWYCPYSDCTQSSTRNWNLKIHIDRRHNGVGRPVRKSQQYAPANTTFTRFNNYGRQNHKRLSISENRSTDLETTDDRHETMLKFLELQRLSDRTAQNWPSKQVFVPYLSTNQSRSDLASNQTLTLRAVTLDLFSAFKGLSPELLKNALTTANLISIPILEPYQDFYQLTNQGTESTIQLEADGLSGHWLGRSIGLGMWKLESDQLFEFLRLTSGSTFGIFKIKAAN